MKIKKVKNTLKDSDKKSDTLFVNLENQIANLVRALPTLSEEVGQKLETTLDRAYLALRNNKTRLTQKYLQTLNQSGGARVTPEEINYTHDRIVELEATAERNNSDLLEKIKQFHSHFDMARDMGLLSNREILSGAQRGYSELHDLLSQPKYKRCRNKTAPITTENVEEVAPENLIVFSNGACWDIEALINYLKAPAPGGANGQNSAEKIKRHLTDYPSDKIWTTEGDYQLMIKHPKALEADLDNFIKERQYAELAKDISEATVRLLYKTASLLLSRGIPFEEAIQTHLNSTQMAEWRRLKAGMSHTELLELLRAPRTNIQNELANIVNVVIKSQAISELLNHLRSVPSKERRSLETIREDFMTILKACSQEKYCDLETGKMVASVYNKIIPFKSGFHMLHNN